MKLTVRLLLVAPRMQQVEVVERKGIGHPDTMCDAIAEHVCVRLCRYYLENFGFILHHNVDKVLLCGGSALATFGGGQILHPIEIYLAGRATEEYRGNSIPIHELAIDACRESLQMRVPGLNVEQDVKVISRIRPGSSDLTRLFESHDRIPVANDTSCGTGFAPLSDLERVVLEVERKLNDAGTKLSHPEIGQDIKVMGARNDKQINLTISCAFVSRFVPNLDEYARQKTAALQLALEAARSVTSLDVDAVINAADDLEKGEVFLTVTGTSAEAGDDGEVGRGNRTCGLITPYRPMTMEAAAGKNPISHVGKIYNIVASRIAATIVADIESITDANCLLLSRIGHAVTDPEMTDIALAPLELAGVEHKTRQLTDIVMSELAQVGALRDALLMERVPLY